MKKLILLSLFLAAIMTACYDDYTSDYEYTATYFSQQYPVRTVIVDPESDVFEIKVGAVYGGRYSYDGASETVTFAIADTLITNNQEYVDMGLKVMPPSWYTLSDDSEIMMQGSNAGFVSVTINKDLLLAHDDASENTYAIPFLMTGATTDSILADKNFSIVVVKFKNEFDGRYYVKGEDKTLNADGTVASSLVYSNPALVLNKFIFLNTTAKNKLSVPRIGSNEEGQSFVYSMEIRNDDGSVLLSSEAGSAVTNLVGEAQYDFATRKFICKYNYSYDNFEHTVTDTLIYANTEINMESWK